MIAFISAILLAFLLVGGAILAQNDQLNVGAVRSYVATLWSQKEDDKPRLPTITPSEAPGQEEENLNYEDRLTQGDEYFEKGFITLAIAQYVEAANLEPDRAEPYKKLLEAHYTLRNYNKALKNAESVLERQPNDRETQFHLIRIYIHLSGFQTAQNLIALYPVDEVTPDPEVLYYKGLLASLFNRTDDARKHLKRLIAVHGNHKLADQAQIVLDAYREFEFTQAAEDLFLRILLARAYNKVGEYEMAIHTLKDVLKTRSDLRDGWILLGFAYLNLEKYYFGLTAFEKAYELDSEWPTTQYFLGIAHKELGNTQDAIIYFDLALNNRFEPKLVLYKHLADLYFDSQQYDQAVQSYEKVLELTQADLDAFVRPVWIYIDFLNQPEKAKRLAQTALASYPENPLAFNLLGWSQTAAGEYQAAEKNLKQAIALDDSMAAAYYNLGNLYEEQNRHSLALDHFKQAYELDQLGSIGNLAAKRYNEVLESTAN